MLAGADIILHLPVLPDMTMLVDGLLVISILVQLASV